MRRPSPLLVAACAAALLAGYVAGILRHFEGRPSALVRFGGDRVAGDPDFRASLCDGFVLMKDSTGYDGQYDYLIARDPFLLRDAPGWRDPYRWQRILHPVLSWCLAAGRPERIPLAMTLVTFAAIALGTWALAVLLPPERRWWALAHALAAGHLYGLRCAVGAPALSLALSVGALLAWDLRRGLLAALLLALAILARESAVLVAVPLAAWSWHQGRRRDACLAASAVLPLLLVQVWLRWRLGAWPLATSGGHVTWPLAGIAERALSLQGSGVDFAASLGGMANNAVLVAFLAWGVWAAVDAAAAWLRGEREAAGFLYLANALFFCLLTKGQLVDLNGASRPALQAFPFMVLSVAGRPGPGRAGRLLTLAGLAFAALVFAKDMVQSPAYVVWHA